jgi:glycosyltransferase involved in cell wall biosynthesis
VSVSESGANDVSSVFDVDRAQIQVIPHGVDLEMHSQRQELSPAIEEVVPREFALYVGNLEPRKNLVELVNAFDSKRGRNLGIPLVIAGKPAWNYGPILSAIESARSVIYLGYVSESDRIALLQRCNVFVFPSLYEGFGLPVLEALAAGAAVATSDRGALAEIAGPAKKFADLDAPGIAAGIDAALGDTDWQSSIRKAGPAWAARFDWSRSVDRHIDVYQKVLAG